MTNPKFENTKAAKAAGWFSKRHENRDAHDQARAAYQNRASARPTQIWNDEAEEWEHDLVTTEANTR